MKHPACVVQCPSRERMAEDQIRNEEGPDASRGGPEGHCVCSRCVFGRLYSEPFLGIMLTMDPNPIRPEDQRENGAEDRPSGDC